MRTTPPETTGPFYPEPSASDGYLDLAHAKGAPALGQRIEVQVRVVDATGRPVRSAILLPWQANAAGRYAHTADTSSAPLDPGFAGHGLARADRDGMLRLRTIRPGAYRTADGGFRTPHLHWQAMGPSGRLVTQMYFDGEPRNAQDLLIARMKKEGRDASQLTARETKPSLDGVETAWVWTIVLPSA